MTLRESPVGITMDDKIMNLSKGWIVVYKDGSVITENDVTWREVKKNQIKVLALKWYNKFWSISGKTSYIQFKRGSVGMSAAGVIDSSVQCEERCIGYYEGSKKVIYRVNDMTGKMTPEVRGPDGSRG